MLNKIILGSILVLLAGSLLVTNPPLAQSACDAPANDPNARAGGLISTVEGISGIFKTTSGTCVIDPKAGISTSNISFAKYKAEYFDKTNPDTATATFTKDAEVSGSKVDGIALNGSKDHLISITGDLTLNNSISGNKSAVIFVGGDLYLKGQKFLYSNTNAAIVFIVQRDIYISPDIDEIDAVLMAGRNLYTAADTIAGCNPSQSSTKNDGSDIAQLVVRGSLMTLDSGTLTFCRNLGARNLDTAAERIEFQAKYLVLMRDLLPYNRPVWQEVP